MKRLLLIFFAALPALAQPTVTSPTVGNVTNSTAWVSATSSVSTPRMRIQYGLTTSYDHILDQGYQQCAMDAVFCPGIYQIFAVVSGLAPSTTYHAEMQASTDGVTWGSSSDFTFSTGAITGVDPAFPAPPETFDPAYPDTSAYTTVTATSCSDANTKLATAVNARGSGWIIQLAPGAFDTTSSTCLQPPTDPSAVSFTSSNVTAGTGTFTVANTFTLNEPIRFAKIVSNGGCLPGYGAGCFAGPIVYGVVYYIVNPSSGSFQVAATPGGSAITFTNTGFATSYAVPVPAPGGPEIIIRTSTADSAFCPSGVRCMGSVWSSRMSTIKVTGGAGTSIGGEFGPLIFDTSPGTHDIRLMGLELTQTDASSDAAVSVDPRPTIGLFHTDPTNAVTRFTIDRDYIHGLGAPNRLRAFVPEFDGKYMAIVDSDLELLDYWRPWVDSGTPAVPGFQPTISGMQISFANGSTFHGGPALGSAQACTSNNLSATITGGSATGTGVIYFALSPPCTPTFVFPTGTTATFLGTGSDGVNTRTPVITTAASPAFVTDPNGNVWGGSADLATIALTSGVPTAVSMIASSQGYPSVLAEGTQGLITGPGPGPFLIRNNQVSGAGLLFHFADGASGIIIPSGFVIRRNTWDFPIKYHTGVAGSDGLDYQQRNPFEFKNGSQLLIDGNTFSHFISGVSSVGAAITLTGRGLATIQDVEIRYNTATDGTYFLAAIGGFASGGQQAPNALIRVWAHDNFINSPNGWTQFSPVARSSSSGPYPFYLGYATEDFRIDHNTVWDVRGIDPAFIHYDGPQPIKGTLLQNNVLPFSNDNNSYGLSADPTNASTPNCSGLGTASLTVDCLLKGVAQYFYTGGNVVVPLYATTNPPSGTADANLTCTKWYASAFTAPITCAGFLAGSNGGTNALVGDSTVPARISRLGFTSTSAASGVNPQLLYNSAYKSGGHITTDGRDAGVDWLKLQAAQGQVGAPSVRGITTSAATISWWAYDSSYACYVDYAIAPNDPSTQTGGGRAHASTGNSQSVTPSGLSALATYNYRILCPVQQPTGSFLTR